MRWVGSVVSVPQGVDRGKMHGGRRNHYETVEVGATGRHYEVHVDDIVEVLSGYLSGSPSRHDAVESEPRLAQVLSLWEDNFTGAFKFRGRWLKRKSQIDPRILSRLRERTSGKSDEARADAPDALMGSNVQLGGEQDDADELVLTQCAEEMNVENIAKPVILSPATSSSTRSRSGNESRRAGPRVSYEVDESTGDVVRLKETDPIFKRARVRRAQCEAPFTRTGRGVDERLSGETNASTTQAGWSQPSAKISVDAYDGIAHDYPEGGTRHLDKSDHDSTPISPARVDDTKARAGSVQYGSDDVERNSAKPGEGSRFVCRSYTRADAVGHAGDGTDGDSAGGKRHRDALDNKATPLEVARIPDCESPIAGVSTSDAPRASIDASVSAPSSPSAQAQSQCPPRKDAASVTSRSRRLAMPGAAVRGPAAALNERKSDALALPADVAQKDPATPISKARPERIEDTPTSTYPSEGDGVEGDSSPTVSKEKAATRDGNSVAAQHFPPLTTRVGENHQADIPPLLSRRERQKPAEADGPRLIWRSTRDWDSESRTFLKMYLEAAKKVVRSHQLHPGVPLHVRLAGGNGGNGDDGAGAVNRDAAGSYAVWAIASSRDSGGVVRVACSEMAQTEVPTDGIQEVQSEEEALSALFETNSILPAYQPALRVLASNWACPGGLERWTLTQVRTLEKLIEKSFDRRRLPHDWCREDMEVEQEDFIDLAAVSRQVPGKTPLQVLTFYYRYFAAAEPLTDVVYGPQAADARKREAVPSQSRRWEGQRNGGQAIDVEESPYPSFKPEPAGTRSRGPGSIGRNEGKSSLQSMNFVGSGGESLSFYRPARGARDDGSHYSNATPYLSRESADKYPSAPVWGSNGFSADDEYNLTVNHQQSDCQGVNLEVTPVEAERVQVGNYRAESEFRARLRSLEQGKMPVNSVSNSSGSTLLRFAADEHKEHLPCTRVSPESGLPKRWTSDTNRASNEMQRPKAESMTEIPRGPISRIEGDEMRVNADGIGQAGSTGTEPRLRPDGPRPHEAHITKEQGTSQRPTENDLGVMAPCWRLLDRAKDFMDPDQFTYMRGLLLAHVKNPMTRDQLFERVQSCLQGNHEILKHFMKMYDRIEQSTLVPLYSPKESYRGAQSAYLPRPAWRSPMARPHFIDEREGALNFNEHRYPEDSPKSPFSSPLHRGNTVGQDASMSTRDLRRSVGPPAFTATDKLYRPAISDTSPKPDGNGMLPERRTGKGSIQPYQASSACGLSSANTRPRELEYSRRSRQSSDGRTMP